MKARFSYEISFILKENLQILRKATLTKQADKALAKINIQLVQKNC
jgi:hypothetical protein